MKNELRIGNWVRHNGSWCYRGEDVYEFQWEESDWYAMGECLLDIDNIEPIELTEYWLERFGFKYYELTNSWFLNDGNGFDISKTNSGGFIIDELTYCPEITFVHQLQNLYHSITGKEL